MAKISRSVFFKLCICHQYDSCLLSLVWHCSHLPLEVTIVPNFVRLGEFLKKVTWLPTERQVTTESSQLVTPPGSLRITSIYLKKRSFFNQTENTTSHLPDFWLLQRKIASSTIKWMECFCSHLSVFFFLAWTHRYLFTSLTKPTVFGISLLHSI